MKVGAINNIYDICKLENRSVDSCGVEVMIVSVVHQWTGSIYNITN